jgi:prevent-host-death family protein
MTKPVKYTIKSKPTVLKEVAVAPGFGEVINLRAAKAHLSALVELVAGGREITITSDGRPKARLIRVPEGRSRKVFPGMGEFLSRQPVHGGPSAEELINQDRDSRDW